MGIFSGSGYRQGVCAVIFLLLTCGVWAEERHSDPDGCLSCHVLPGLERVDNDGVLRSFSIDRSHYYSSLHGSVPCKDCHRKIQDYPHTVENGYVDCSESCHVKEPSKGEAFTHKAVMKELEKSVHGTGWYKDLAGGNRLKEEQEEANPSCRRCHSNTLYIDESQIELFKEAFAHTDTECGNCHQGDVWRNQFGGHILRRFLGKRWKKEAGNDLCNTCHANHALMAKVEIKDNDTGKKEKVDFRWIHASDSYAKSLHNRLMVKDIDNGASCLDCHAPEGMGWRHEILRDENKQASTHPDTLGKTCGQSGCHEFTIKSSWNTGFVMTDMHDVDMVRPNQLMQLFDLARTESAWFVGGWLLIPFSLVAMIGSGLWLLVGKRKKKIESLVGGNYFERVMIGRKGKKSAGARKPRAKRPMSKPETPVKSTTTDNTEHPNAEGKPDEVRKSRVKRRPVPTPEKPVNSDVSDTAVNKKDEGKPDA